MTMFADSDAAKVGLDVVKRDYPQFTGKGVRLLQVELDNGSGWTNPDANLYLPATATLKTGYHATEVGKVIRAIAPNATIVNMEEQTFINTLMNSRTSNGFSIPTWDPTPPVWNVECHAYTATRSIADVEICRAQDKRVSEHEIEAFAACGNTLTDVKGEWNRSVQTNIVGTPTSPKGNFPIGGGLTQPYPDYTIPTQWTSIAAPVMAAGYALLLEAAGMDHDKAISALKVSDTNGLPQFDKAITTILGVTTEPPVEPPPPVIEPPPPPPPVVPPPGIQNITKLAQWQTMVPALEPQEGLAKLTDGQVGTKCLHFNKWTEYIFDFGTPYFVDKAAIWSANDYPQRDAQEVYLYRDDGQFDWVEVGSWPENSWSARQQKKEFPITATRISARRWKIYCGSSGLTSPGDKGTGILQIAELEIWGEKDTGPIVPPPEPGKLPEDCLLDVQSVAAWFPILNEDEKILLRELLTITAANN